MNVNNYLYGFDRNDVIDSGAGDDLIRDSHRDTLIAGTGNAPVMQLTRTLSLSHIWRWLVSTTIGYLPGTRSASWNLSGRNKNQPVQIGPYSLVQLAYHGELSQQGIPSHIALLNAHRMGRVNAITLAKGAVKARLISTTALTDLAYLQAIETGFLLHYLLHPSELFVNSGDSAQETT